MPRVASQFYSPLSLCLLSTLLLTITSVTSCPSDCNCKWKGGKQSVDCINRGLRTFPGPIDAGTQVLDLSGNSFETLPSDHFMRLSLINLQKIYLAKCRLSHINSRAFRGLSNLVDLDLTNNVLREVPTSSFPDCQGLMRLILSGNPIQHLGRNAFMSLEVLTTLEMSNCGIEIIDKGAFENMPSLEWLKLSGNKMKRLEGLDSLPLSLKGIWLEENPWDCDCHLLPLRLWLGERKVGNPMEPRCFTPNRLTNSTLRDLSVENFACTPQLSPTTAYQKIGEGKNVSLLCKVTSTPESTLEWWFNGQPVTNTSLNLVVETSSSFQSGALGATPRLPSASERKSELLILNATADENGTFLCLARNPGGTVMANFTLRVLTPIDPEILAENSTSLVGAYPNLFLIAVSTVAVIGVVIVMFGVTLVICRCARLCRMDGRRRREGRLGGSGARGKGGSGGSSEDNGKGGGGGGGSGVKMERHPSETSTLTTHTKSNGSVFLLSTSSELGDSNPDLIEGVNNKRVEADGHETSFSHLANGSAYPSSEPHPSAHSQNPEHSYSQSVYPLDYGLPKALNTSTLLRRSPSYQMNTLPPSYDLAKYPKEYINPAQIPTTYMYGGHGGPILYASAEDYHQTAAYPAYIIPHPGTYVYHGMAPGSEPSFLTLGGYLESVPGGSGSCSCGPILEGNEEAEEPAATAVVPPVPSAMTSSSAPPSHPPGPKAEALTVKARLQRQLTTQINESPDEGYEDESAEGTEI